MDESLLIVSREEMLRRICGEYLEMPGLRLTHKQAQRLWALDEQTCTQLLEFLVEAKFLCRTGVGGYARFTDGTVAFSPPLRVTNPQLNLNTARSRPDQASSAA